MGGFFGVTATDDCVTDLFFGTDYHSHLGTMRGGLATKNSGGIVRFIHDITNTPFRSKFENDVSKLHGTRGIGVISDHDDQPLIIRSHLGTFAIVTVGVIQNIEEIIQKTFAERRAFMSEMSGETTSPTEVTAMLITQEESFTDGLAAAQEAIDGSCSILLLTDEGIYAARDRLGRTPVILGKREDGARAVTMETCALPNLGFTYDRDLGPGEVVRMTEEGVEQTKPPGDEMKICAFLWVYYGYPASHYEGINVEQVRYRCGASLARREDPEVEIDMVCGIPDSGTGHAIGYSRESGIPFGRPYVKYTPTWPRSFMPQDQSIRDLVAKMKLIQVPDLIEGKRLLFCEDSIVRGTQLQDTVQRLYEGGAREIHMRPACPPLVHGCRYLNFSRSRSELDLAGRRALAELEGTAEEVPPAYSDPDTDEYRAMVDRVRDRLKLTTLTYQRLDDLIEAIGLPREKVCTYCWDRQG
jgi:amidophosphoribosyltransferase